MLKNALELKLASIRKQRTVLTKKESALLRKFHVFVLAKILKLAKSFGLTATDIINGIKRVPGANSRINKKPTRQSSRKGTKVAP